MKAMSATEARAYDNRWNFGRTFRVRELFSQILNRKAETLGNPGEYFSTRTGFPAIQDAEGRTLSTSTAHRGQHASARRNTGFHAAIALGIDCICLHQ